jgi:hypothetical protein
MSLSGNLKRRDHSEDLDIDRKIIIRMELREIGCESVV